MASERIPLNINFYRFKKLTAEDLNTIQDQINENDHHIWEEIGQSKYTEGVTLHKRIDDNLDSINFINSEIGEWTDRFESLTISTVVDNILQSIGIGTDIKRPSIVNDIADINNRIGNNPIFTSVNTIGYNINRIDSHLSHIDNEIGEQESESNIFNEIRIIKNKIGPERTSNPTIAKDIAINQNKILDINLRIGSKFYSTNNISDNITRIDLTIGTGFSPGQHSIREEIGYDYNGDSPATGIHGDIENINFKIGADFNSSNTIRDNIDRIDTKVGIGFKNEINNVVNLTTIIGNEWVVNHSTGNILDVSIGSYAENNNFEINKLKIKVGEGFSDRRNKVINLTTIIGKYWYTNHAELSGNLNISIGSYVEKITSTMDWDTSVFGNISIGSKIVSVESDINNIHSTIGDKGNYNNIYSEIKNINLKIGNKGNRGNIYNEINDIYHIIGYDNWPLKPKTVLGSITIGSALNYFGYTIGDWDIHRNSITETIDSIEGNKSKKILEETTTLSNSNTEINIYYEKSYIFEITSSSTQPIYTLKLNENNEETEDLLYLSNVKIINKSGSQKRILINLQNIDNAELIGIVGNEVYIDPGKICQISLERMKLDNKYYVLGIDTLFDLP